MATTIIIDPLTRIEGHSKHVIVVDTATSSISAKAAGTMFRGFENILAKRDQIGRAHV